MLPLHPVEELLWDIDQRWVSDGEPRIALRVLGSSALFLQTDYRRGTKDSDVLETTELTGPIRLRLTDLAGAGSALHREHGMYVEILANAYPFLPVEPAWVPRAALNADLAHFTVEALDVVDVVVAKLARLHGADRGDILAMVERGLVDPHLLVDRFRSAVGRVWMDARADDLPRYVRNLNWLQRDLLGAPETEVDLPPGVAND